MATQILLFAPGGPAVWVKSEGLRQTTTQKKNRAEQSRAERWKGGEDGNLVVILEAGGESRCTVSLSLTGAL